LAKKLILLVSCAQFPSAFCFKNFKVKKLKLYKHVTSYYTNLV
jgi:hypothetical protein